MINYNKGFYTVYSFINVIILDKIYSVHIQANIDHKYSHVFKEIFKLIW